MGCNCKKQSKVEIPYQTPEPIKVPQPPVQEDWYNNIDIIEPINVKDIKTENNG
jgi:hypothetical protein